MLRLRTVLTRKSQRQIIDDNPLGFDRSRLTLQQEILLRSLLNEFYSSAKLTVAFASIVSARTRGIRLQNVSRPLAYIPADPLIFPAVAAGLAPALGHSGLISGLHEYYTRVTFARGLSGIPALVQDDGNAGHLELVQLADVWQRVCALASIVAHLLYDVESAGDPVRKNQLISIHRLINDAKIGNSPCVRNDGTVFVPGWLDHRRNERRAVGWQVWLESSGKRDRATLRDISAGGMGLTTCHNRPVGTQVSVQLADARCLAGVVTWSQNDRIGVKFLQPLSATDPLLTSAYDNPIGSSALN